MPLPEAFYTVFNSCNIRERVPLGGFQASQASPRIACTAWSALFASRWHPGGLMYFKFLYFHLFLCLQNVTKCPHRPLETLRAFKFNLGMFSIYRVMLFLWQWKRLRQTLCLRSLSRGFLPDDVDDTGGGGGGVLDDGGGGGGVVDRVNSVSDSCTPSNEKRNYSTTAWYPWRCLSRPITSQSRGRLTHEKYC